MTPALLDFIAVALATAISAVIYRRLATVRARRRAAGELDRAESRLWITRLEEPVAVVATVARVQREAGE